MKYEELRAAGISWGALLGYPDASVRAAATRALANEAHPDPGLLARMRHDVDANVRIESVLLRNSYFPQGEAAMRLFDAPSPAERRIAALNSWNPHVLAVLARDPDPAVREALAGNSQLTSKTQDALAQDEDEDVRVALAQNSYLQSSAFHVLRADRIPRVVKAVQRGYKDLKETKRDDFHATGKVLGRGVYRVLSRGIGQYEKSLSDLIRVANYDTLVRIARHGWVPRAVVELLASSGEPSVRRLAASNPATPAKVLTDLIYDSDVAVVSASIGNANFPENLLRLLVEDPAFLRHWGVDSRLCALANPRVDVDLEQFAHGKYAKGVARNPRTEPKLLRTLAESDDDETLAAVAAHAATPVDVLVDIARRNADATGVARALVSNQNATADVLRALAGDPSSRLFVAKSERAPADVLAGLARDSDLWVRRAVALNPGTPPEVAQGLAADHDDQDPRANMGRVDLHLGDLEFKRWEAADAYAVEHSDLTDVSEPHTVAEMAASLVELLDARTRAWLRSTGLGVPLAEDFVAEVLSSDAVPSVIRATAGNPRTPASILARFAEHEDVDVRQAVAGATGDPELLRRLAADSKKEVADAVLSNPCTPADVLDLFTRRSHVLNQRDIAEHRNASEAALDALTTSEHADVRAAVVKHPRTSAAALDALANDGNADIRGLVAAHPRTAPTSIARLARDSSSTVRLTVVLHPKAPQESLRELTRDPSEMVRQAVAMCSRTPADSFAVLALDSDASVRSLALTHMRAPAKVWLAVAQDPAATSEVLDVAARSSANEVKWAVAAHLHASPDALRSLAQDVDQALRLRILERADTPDPVLELLARDPTWKVRRAAKARRR